MQFTPRDYQSDIINHIVTHKSAFVLAQMGAGKTVATLEAIHQIKPKRVLLIAPLRVAQYTWPSEIAKWDNFSHYRYTVAVGTPKARKAAIEARAPLTIINTENLLWFLTEYGKSGFDDFDMVIIDESSMFKSQSSKRFKELKKWRRKAKVSRWVLLTATPTPNSLLEIWPQTFLLDGGERLGTAFGAFRLRYFDSDFMGYKWTPKAHADDMIHRKVSDISIVVERYDGLPERVDIIEPVTMPKQAMELYQALVKDLLIEMSDKDITAVNAAVLAGKLQQMASGAIYAEDGSYEVVHNEKIKALRSLMDEVGHENVIVTYNYQHELERILAEFPEAVHVKEKDSINRWNKGEIKMLISHPASMAHGINAQEGGRRIIWFSPTWSNELDAQFNARLHRQGQKDTVFVHKLVTQETIDYNVLDIVRSKRSVQDALLAAVKTS